MAVLDQSGNQTSCEPAVKSYCICGSVTVNIFILVRKSVRICLDYKQNEMTSQIKFLRWLLGVLFESDWVRYACPDITTLPGCVDCRYIIGSIAWLHRPISLDSEIIVLYLAFQKVRLKVLKENKVLFIGLMDRRKTDYEPLDMPNLAYKYCIKCLMFE